MLNYKVEKLKLTINAIEEKTVYYALWIIWKD